MVVAAAAAFGALASGGCGDGLPLATWELAVDGAAPEPVELPSLLPSVPDRELRYVLRTTVEVPEAWRGKPLSLDIDSFLGAVDVRADGEPAAAVVGQRLGYRSAGPQVVAIAPNASRDGVVELELAVAHQWVRSAWWPSVPRLAPYPAGAPSTRAVAAFNKWTSLSGFFTLAMTAFLCASIFFHDRTMRAFFWLGIQSGTATYYMLFETGHAPLVVGRSDGALFAAVVMIAFVASIHATNSFFALGPVSRRWHVALAGGLVVAAVAHGPFVTVYALVPYVGVLVSAVLGYQLLVLARKVREGALNARLQLASWGVMLSIAPCDLALWLGQDFFGGLHLAGLAVTVFTLVQFLALSRQYLTALEQASALNDQLEARVQEIEFLNVELRRQIGDRSRQLAEALARQAGGGKVGELAAGEEVDGRYKVVEPLGAGAMGRVYRVTRLADGRDLAMKVLGRVGDAQSMARLAREAQLVSEIHHCNVVEVADVGFAASGFMYLVMELVRGKTLRDHKDRFGDAGWAMPLLAQVVSALDAVHRHGVVHRDLKPANILVQADGGEGQRVKIADFGIAGVASEGMESADPGFAGKPAAVATSVAGSDAGGGPATAPTAPLASPVVAGAAALAAETTLTVAPAPTVSSTEATMTLTPTAVRLASASGSSATPRTPELTEVGAILGTPAYMAPELAGGASDVTPRSDMFSFGVLAYEMLSGARPFALPPLFSIQRGEAVEPPAPLAAQCGIDAAATRVIDACLALDPTARPDAATVGAAIQGAVIQGAARAAQES